jgi:hypothetical protein
VPDKDYSHRSLADKLGLKAGMRIRVSGDVGEKLELDAAERVGGSTRLSKDLDLIVRGIASVGEAEDFFARERPRLADHAAIWLVTRKRGDARYVQQEDLMPLAKSFDLVDNKVCAVDDQHSAIRFVIPKHLRNSR